MTRNDSDSPPASRRAQREPLNWPTATLGIVALGVLAFVAWICGGVAVEIWGP